MTKNDLRDVLGVPVRIDERVGHLWFPTLHAFNEQDVLCIAAIGHDQSQGVWPAAAYWSRDGGRRWRWVAEISHYALASVLIGPRERLLLPYELVAAPTQTDPWAAAALGTRVTLAHHGAFQISTHLIRFEHLPRAVAQYPQGGLRLVTGGTVVTLADGSLFMTLYGRFQGETQYSLLGVVSHDQGCTWSFRAQIANRRDLPHTEEGPSEASTIVLADGTLACLYRVGSGAGQDYYRSDSIDGGHHWSTPHPLSGIGSVKPQWLRCGNGALLLTSGRPGLTLWRSPDGQVWQSFDLLEHHNATVHSHGQRFKTTWTQSAITTGYTALCALGAGKALVCYDRLGNGWRGAPGPHGATDAVYCLSLECAALQEITPSG